MLLHPSKPGLTLSTGTETGNCLQSMLMFYECPLHVHVGFLPLLKSKWFANINDHYVLGALHWPILFKMCHHIMPSVPRISSGWTLNPTWPCQWSCGCWAKEWYSKGKLNNIPFVLEFQMVQYVQESSARSGVVYKIMVRLWYMLWDEAKTVKQPTLKCDQGQGISRCRDWQKLTLALAKWQEIANLRMCI